MRKSRAKRARFLFPTVVFGSPFSARPFRLGLLGSFFSHARHGCPSPPASMSFKFVPLLALGAVASVGAQQPAASADPYMARAIRVLTAQPIVDGHNDLPWRIREDKAHPMDVEAYDLRKHVAGMTDLARLKTGH